MVSVSYNMENQLSVGSGVGEIVALATAVAAAQQFGSALYTRFTHQPLRDLIHALNNDQDISPRRYHGSRIYDEETGEIMTMQGEIKAVAMGKVAEKEGENPTQLSTIIVCLSVAMEKGMLSATLAEAIMLFVHGTLERPMEGTVKVLQGKIEKYATSVLSRDRMCGRLEGKRQEMRRLVQLKAPEVLVDAMFHPAQTPQEEGDFVEFLVELWTSHADETEIFTRSIKLLGLALLLSEYGWQIDVFVEIEAEEFIPLKTDTRALSVIYSVAKTPATRSRKYVENHQRYLRVSRREFYPTAVCTTEYMGQVSGLTLAKSSSDRDKFEMGYEAARGFYELNYEIKVSLMPEGRISMKIESLGSATGRFPRERSCRQLLKRFLPPTMPDLIWALIAGALCNQLEKAEWSLIEDDMNKQKFPLASFTTLLSFYDGNCENLWVVAGAVLGVLDIVITSLINLPPKSVVRTPAGESISKFVSGSGHCLNNLLTTGLEPGLAVQLCATRLAGVDPDNLRFASNANPNNLIGYWNGQQGILVTPVFERSLFSDLPEKKSRPLSFFSIPIEGMPTDDGGWIRPGAIRSGPALARTLESTDEDGTHLCNVIMEYRPHFEVDSNSVVAAAYIDGVFCNLLSLSDTLSHHWHIQSECNHKDEPLGLQLRHIGLQHLTSGNVPFPNEQDIWIIGPQRNNVSRFFSSIIYKASKPIIQDGCLGCALELKLHNRGGVIIPKAENGAKARNRLLGG